MRLLIDMNLSPDWVGYFAEEGVEAIHWSTVGDQAAPDDELMCWALREGRIVFTHDLDFSAILAATGGNAPSVIQLRVQDVTPEATGDLVLRALRQFSGELDLGALVSIDASRSRVRVLPL